MAGRPRFVSRHGEPYTAALRRNPDSGATDARVLHALAWLGGNNDITFGVWSDIIPGPYSCR